MTEMRYAAAWQLDIISKYEEVFLNEFGGYHENIKENKKAA